MRIGILELLTDTPLGGFLDRLYAAYELLGDDLATLDARARQEPPAIDAGCTAGTVSLGCRAMRRLTSILAVALTTHACTSTQTAGSPPSCSRIEASAKFALTGFDVMGEMPDKCADGTQIVACFPGTYVFGAAVSALVAPLLFAVGSMSDTAQRHQCPPGATTEKASEGTSAHVPVALGVGR